MFLSVNIPVYNAEKYLHECIDSVLSQSFSDFEIILIDDGSTDSSGTICDEYAARDSRIKVLHLENGGCASARRHGLAESSGDYIFMMDADDVIYPELFEKLYSVAKSQGPDMIAFDYETFGGSITVLNKNGLPEGLYEGKKLANVLSSLVYDKHKRSFNYGCLIYSLCCKAYRRSFLSEYFPTLPRGITKGEDLAVSAVLACHAKSIYFMDFCGYRYRTAEGSMMHSFKEGEIENYMCVCDFLKANAPAVSDRSIAAWAMYMFLEYCKSAANVAESAEEFEQIIERNMDAGFFAVISAARLFLPRRRDIRHMRLVKDKKFKALFMLLKGEE